MPINLKNSRIESFRVFGRDFFVKRDDLLDDALNGNKARKFYSLFKNPPKIEHYVSYGGVQSNAFYSLSALAKRQNKKFTYYVKAIPKLLKKTPIGNFKAALENNANVIELGYENFCKQIESIKKTLPPSSLFIPQGGACELAKEGVELLAEEIDSFIEWYKLRNPLVITSSGTGATAYFLANSLRLGEVVTTPSVGSKEYLKEQMRRLGRGRLPSILDTKERIIFGKPHKRLFEMYKFLLNKGIEFDLLYDIKSWLVIYENLKLFEGRAIIFIHSGGIMANYSMIDRYVYELGMS